MSFFVVVWAGLGVGDIENCTLGTKEREVVAELDNNSFVDSCQGPVQKIIGYLQNC